MKRAALLVMLLAATVQPALADVLVVRYSFPGTTTPAINQARDYQWAVIREILDTYVGPDHWQAVDPRGTKTLWCNTGTQVFGATERQFDVVMHVGFTLNASATVFPFTGSPVRVDSLLRSAIWNGGSGYGTSVPQIIVGAPAADANQWTGSTACSTGATGYASGFSSARRYHSAYMVGQPWAWKQPLTAVALYGVPALGSAGARVPGIFRPVVSYGATGIVSAAALNCGTLTNGNCDAVTRSADPDSLLLWVRYRDSTDVAPRIFVQPGGIGWPDIGLIKMALAIADSVTDGAVFEEPKLLNRKRAIWIKHGFSRSRYDDMNAQESGGTFCAADTCDSANVVAGIDSLASLDVPFTVGVEADSLNGGGAIGDCVNATSPGYPNEVAWWTRAPRARFGLEVFSGWTERDGGDVVMGRGQQSIGDPFGAVRARTMLPGDWTEWPHAYLDAGTSNEDSSTYGLLAGALCRLKAIFPGKVDPSVFPAFSDWSPPAATNANLGEYADSVAWVAYHAGFRTIVFNPLEPQGNVGRQWSSNGLSPTYSSAPWGGNPNGRVVRVGSDSPRGTPFAGRIKFTAARFEAGLVHATSFGTHGINVEWEHGNLMRRWYPGEVDLGAFYKHDFLTRTPIVAFSAGQLGGAGDGTNPPREAWWNIKWLVHESRAVDALMIPGKVLDSWGYASEVEP